MLSEVRAHSPSRAPVDMYEADIASEPRKIVETMYLVLVS
jgi:hypothetical protein